MDQAFFDKISADASLGMSIFYNKNRRTFLMMIAKNMMNSGLFQ
jgi:hypothetical protein